jgi:hypothetical protein
VIEGVDTAILAKSANAALLNDENSIIVETDSLHGIWSNKVGIVEGWQPSWYEAAVAVVVLVSLLFAFLTASMVCSPVLHYLIDFSFYMTVLRMSINSLLSDNSIVISFTKSCPQGPFKRYNEAKPCSKSSIWSVMSNLFPVFKTMSPLIYFFVMSV